jgi:hypothetical protein
MHIHARFLLRRTSALTLGAWGGESATESWTCATKKAGWHGTSIGWLAEVTMMPRYSEKIRPILATVQDRPLTEITILY